MNYIYFHKESYVKPSDHTIPMFCLNPNPNKDVKGTPLLNSLSKIFRDSSFGKECKEGFELSPFDFKWEYFIYGPKEGKFVVFRELNSTTIKGWIYKTKNDLSPGEIVLRYIDVSDRRIIPTSKRFNKLIKDVIS